MSDRKRAAVILQTVLLFVLFLSTAGAAYVAPPTALTVLGASPSKMKLSWRYSGATNGFDIDRASGGTANFTRIARVGNTVRSYTDSGLYADTNYIYRIRAFKNGNNVSVFTAPTLGYTFPLQPPVITFAPVSTPTAVTTKVNDHTFVWSAYTTVQANVFVDGQRPTDVLAYKWAEKTGPGAASISTPAALQTYVIFPAPGSYVLSFSVDVNGGLVAASQDSVQIASR